MSVNKALDSILEGKLDAMRSNFSSALSTKAVEKLEERKIEIAQKYFGQIQEATPADEGRKAVQDDDKKREKHMEKYGKLPARLTGALADKFANRKAKSKE